MRSGKLFLILLLQIFGLALCIRLGGFSGNAKGKGLLSDAPTDEDSKDLHEENTFLRAKLEALRSAYSLQKQTSKSSVLAVRREMEKKIDHLTRGLKEVEVGADVDAESAISPRARVRSERSSSNGERERHTYDNGVVQHKSCYQLYT